MSDKPRASFLSPEPVAYCYETPLYGWEIASRAAAAAEPELRWRAMVTLTDAEREALAWAALHLDHCGWGSATIRGLLERLP